MGQIIDREASSGEAQAASEAVPAAAMDVRYFLSSGLIFQRYIIITILNQAASAFVIMPERAIALSATQRHVPAPIVPFGYWDIALRKSSMPRGWSLGFFMIKYGQATN